jgi:hypothetical protein
VVWIATGREFSKVSFDYDPDVINLVKSIPLRSFDARRKLWLIPAERTQDLADLLTEHNIKVRWNGTPYRHSTPLLSQLMAERAHPLTAWFNQLPDELRLPVYRALAGVLDGHQDQLADLDRAAGEVGLRRRRRRLSSVCS